MSVVSSPAFIAKHFGIIYKAFAYAATNYCDLSVIFFDYYLKYLLNYISIAPPPATTSVLFIDLLTTIIASFNDLSA